MQRTIQVYTPAPGSSLAAMLAPGSGIVGFPVGDQICIYYEGNIYNSKSMETWQARVRQAAGRLLTHYPTTAMSAVIPTELVQVGELVQYSTDDHHYGILVTDMAALAAYTGETELDLIGAATQSKTISSLAAIGATLRTREGWPVAKVNETVEHYLTEIARATGNTEAGLRAVFGPRSNDETWFGLDGKNHPGNYLWNAACNQSMNFQKWAA